MQCEDEGCLPLVVALIALMVLVESVDEVVGEEAADGSFNVLGMRERKRCRG